MIIWGKPMDTQDKYTRLPLLNDKAPDFDALTTDGQRKLSDYKGKWLVLFSHPADFTPVCTTEFLSFAVNVDNFDKLNCALLGLSIDSHYSHIAWKRNIEQNFGVYIPFPIIADIDMKVAMAYGMIHPKASDTSPVRALFVIDPNAMLRAMIYYPMRNGRSVKEVLRLVKSLQVADEHGVATPEGWAPGEDVIVAPPTTCKAAVRRQEMAESDPLYRYTDWYFCERPIDHISSEEKMEVDAPSSENQTQTQTQAQAGPQPASPRHQHSKDYVQANFQPNPMLPNPMLPNPMLQRANQMLDQIPDQSPDQSPVESPIQNQAPAVRTQQQPSPPHQSHAQQSHAQQSAGQYAGNEKAPALAEALENMQIKRN